MFIVTNVMCAGRRRFRFNKYMFPFIDCVIRIYADSGGPIPIKSIIECMKERHGIRGVRNIYEGRDAAVDNGYITEVHVTPKRYYYVPTLIGTIDTGIYQALAKTLSSSVKSSPETMYTFIRFMRFMVFWDSLRKYDNVPWIMDFNKVYYYKCNMCLGQSNCPRNLIDSCNMIEEVIKSLRDELFYGAVIAKAIAGVEVRGLKPMQLGNVFAKTIIIASKYAEKFIAPSDSADVYSIYRKISNEVEDQQLLKAMEHVHRRLDAMVNKAAIYLTNRLVGNLMSSLSKPLTNATVNSEGKQHRLER